MRDFQQKKQFSIEEEEAKKKKGEKERLKLKEKTDRLAASKPTLAQR
jgi:hypothetical protein